MNNGKIKRIAVLVWYFGLLLISSFYVQAQDSPSKKLTSTEKSPDSQESRQIASKQELTNSVMSREEKLIRDTYKKLSVYEVSERVKKADRENKSRGQELAKNSLRFKLKSFHVGPIQEILNVKYRDLVTAPSGEIIQISTGTGRTNVTNLDGPTLRGEEKFYVDANWKSAQYVSNSNEDWSVGDIIQLEAIRFNGVGKYASYEVTVSLEGKTKTYRAMAFFRNPYQSSEPLNADFLDSIVGMGGVITEIRNERKLPVGMVTLSEARQIIRNKNIGGIKQLENTEKETSNLFGDICEISNFKSEAEFNFDDGCDCVDIDLGDLCWIPSFPFPDPIPMPDPIPIPPIITSCPFKIDRSGVNNKNDLDGTNHSSGNHWASTGFESTCVRDVSCNVHCQVTDLTSNYGDDENGRISIYYHIGRKNTAYEDHDGVINQDITCKRTNGFGFKYCFFRDCSFNISVNLGGAVTITPSDSNDLWSVSQTQLRSCRMSRND